MTNTICDNIVSFPECNYQLPYKLIWPPTSPWCSLVSPGCRLCLSPVLIEVIATQDLYFVYTINFQSISEHINFECNTETGASSDYQRLSRQWQTKKGRGGALLRNTSGDVSGEAEEGGRGGWKATRRKEVREGGRASGPKTTILEKKSECCISKQ